MSKKIVSLAEMSKAAGVNPRRLRYLDKTGEFKPIKITDSGYRYYSLEQMAELLRIEGKRIVIVYQCCANLDNLGNLYEAVVTKETLDELEEIKEEVKEYITDFKIVTMFDIWTGDIKDTRIEEIIQLASQGLVEKVIIPTKKNFIPGDYDEYRKWLDYMNCELLDLIDFENKEGIEDADKRSCRKYN